MIISKGKRKDNGEWIEGYYVCVAKNTHYIFTGKFNRVGIEYYEVLPETVGWNMDQTDDNGKKIFSGDVIEVCKKGPDVEICEVKLVDGILAVDSIEHHNYELKKFCGITRITVIGNISDNPELRVCPFCGSPDCHITKAQVLKRGPIIEDNVSRIMRLPHEGNPQTYAFEGVRAYYSLSALIPDPDEEDPHAYIRFVYDEDEDCADDWETWDIPNPLSFQTEEEAIKKLEKQKNG